jgi:2-polyprenyl-3-methyl-5-hydroxy-6-metoxy-1,4-benzoquinol methylase
MIRSLQLETVSCGVCDADDWQHYALGKDYEYHTSDDEFRMVECLECGNIYLNPRPIKEELSTIYPPNYYAYNYDTAISPIALKAKDWLDGIKVKQWLNHVSTSLPQFLDVGCGNGRYLQMLHQLGVPKEKLYGVDMDTKQIAELKSQGFQSYLGRIEDIDFPEASFDLIVLLQVLEHVNHPKTLVQSLASLLNKGGVLIVETPNTASIDAKQFRKSYWGGYHFPRHWNLMNKSTLSRLAQENGLKVKCFNYLPSHSFWIFSLHHLIEDKWRLPWLARIFDPFQNLILLSFFTFFDLFRAKLGFQTSNIQLVAVKL